MRTGLRARLTSAVVLCTTIAAVQLAAPAAHAATASSISAGFGHACVVTSTSGGVKCWGGNDYGELGDGTTRSSSTPVSVSGLSSKVAAVSAGANNSCALTNAGAVLCWGVASRLGNGSTVNSSRPVGVTGLSSGVSAISAGGDHVCALTNGGAVVCWGNNTYGGLGDGTGIASSTPVPVVGLSSGVASISSGARHTCAVTAAGGVWCWGYNAYGELGDGTTTNGLVPVPVAGLSSGVSAVAAGGFHSCAITTAGATVCWGQNVYGQLGDGTTTDSPTPVAAFGLSAGTAAVTGGTYHTCAITTAGEARCWGSNNTGQIGDGTLVNRSVPTTVSGLSSGVVRISGGRGSTCAVTTTGRALCWGWNLFGQLGDGSTVNRLAPVTVAGYAK